MTVPTFAASPTSNLTASTTNLHAGESVTITVKVSNCSSSSLGIIPTYDTLLPELYSVNQNVDFNGDGFITSDDAIYLLYYTLLPDLYPIG